MAQGSDGIFPRIRRVFFRHGDGDATTAAVSAATRVSTPGLHAFHEPGPFDEPPTEPVHLDPEALPWELRDVLDAEPREPSTS
jgi:hypothetical protein